MLSDKELEILRKNGQIHKKIFDAIRPKLIAGSRAIDIDSLAASMCRDAGVVSAFTGVYGYKYALQTSVNDVVVHGRPLESIIFTDGDVVTIDFGVKDKKYGICTDAAFTVIIGDENDHPEKKEFLQVSQEALKLGVAEAKVGNYTGDIGNAVYSHISKHGYYIIKELTGHGVGKSLHEEPYVYNYGNPGTGTKLKEGMILAIEPIVGYSSGKIIDKGDWEIYVADGSIGSQFEHTVHITKNGPEIIV